jgi:hypothetical protein
MPALPLPPVAVTMLLLTITGGEQIIGIFYGNMTICSVEGAHNDYARLMADEAIDFAASPFAYTKGRAQGVHWGFQCALECAGLHGKPFFVESDVRTCLSRPLSEAMPESAPHVNRLYDGVLWRGPPDVRGSLGQMIRAFGDAALHGAAMWWFDMLGGWYASEPFMEFHKRACELYPVVSTAEPQAAIAVFVDEAAIGCFTERAVETCSSLLFRQMSQIGASGAMYHTYMLTDLPQVDPERYRMAILVFPAFMEPETRAALAKWRRGGRTVVQTFLPGYYGSGIEAATGFRVHEAPGIRKVSASWHGQAFVEEPARIPDIRIEPAYGDIVLAVTDDGDPAVIMRRHDDYQEVLALVPCMPAGLVRELVLLSAGHVWSHTGDCISANSRYVCIHAASDGVKRIYLPRKGRLLDIFSGEILKGNETWTEMEMGFGDSRIFEIV